MSSSPGIENEINVDSRNHLTNRRGKTVTPQSGSGFGWVHGAFGFAVILIASASIYDAFLVYEYREGIVEQNPICNWLIRQEPKSVSLFLVAKGAGTAGVVSVLLGLFVFWRRAGIAAAIALVFFQTGLMYYLHTSDVSRPNYSAQYAGSPNGYAAIQPIDTNDQSTLSQKRTRSKFDSIEDSKNRKRTVRRPRLAAKRRSRFRSHADGRENRNRSNPQRKSSGHQSAKLPEAS